MTYHGSTGITPFKALYGWEPPTLLRRKDETSKVEAVDEMLRERNVILDELKENLRKAQDKMKKFVDRRRSLTMKWVIVCILKCSPTNSKLLLPE